MKKLTVYEYARCSTCQKALKFLDKNKIAYEKVPIVDTPPSKADLKKMLGYLEGNLRKLFNTSGVQYRELGLSSKMDSMTQDEAFALLSENGKLVKRPFLLGDGFGCVGFKEEEWKKALG
jgi:arsenate reductase